MKLLILSCNTGEGHHSAALAVQEALNARGVPNDIMDPLSSVGEATRKRVCELYNSIIRNMPKAFGLIYRAGELVDDALPGSPVYFANSLYASRLLDCIREGGYDGVISTHLYGMEAMTAIRRKLGVHVPNYGVLTDYTRIPFFSDVQLDGYFIPHRDLAAELAEKGMDARLLIPTGIPVSERFAHALPQDEARRRLNLPEGKRVYLIMTGGVHVDADLPGEFHREDARLAAVELVQLGAQLLVPAGEHAGEEIAVVAGAQPVADFGYVAAAHAAGHDQIDALARRQG